MGVVVVGEALAVVGWVVEAVLLGVEEECNSSDKTLIKVVFDKGPNKCFLMDNH